MLTDDERRIHAELGIPADYGAGGMPPRYRDCRDLIGVGPNLVGREQQLTPDAAAAWADMVAVAENDGIRLLIVSGFRSFEYQAGLLRGKLEAGQCIDDILSVNAAPGFSQHHTGAAIDIATPGSRPLTEAFEASPAFAWLQKNAGRFGFALSYPRGNREGFVYEPWHWALADVVSA